MLHTRSNTLRAIPTALFNLIRHNQDIISLHYYKDFHNKTEAVDYPAGGMYAIPIDFDASLKFLFILIECTYQVSPPTYSSPYITSISHIILTLIHALRQNPYTQPIQNNLLIRHLEVYGRFQILLPFS